MRLYLGLRMRLAMWRRNRRLAGIFERFQDFTMIPEATYLDNLRLAERVGRLAGCVVECGVWRGGMSAGLAVILGADRQYCLFDSFQGLPPAREIDGKAALEWQRDTNSLTYHDNCSASADFAEKAMQRAGARTFQLCKGWFDKTLPAFIPPAPIALLRLDGDWYDSTMLCLNHLFDRVATGGLIVFDDYYTWDGCSRAVHDFLSRRSATERIRSFGDICYMLKAAPPLKNSGTNTPREH